MLEPVPFALPPQNVTVVGSFNPAILRPAWLQRRVSGFGEKGVELLAPLDLGPLLLREAGDPPAPLVLEVSPDRLIVFGPIIRGADTALAILQQLPHTPLRAIGLNFMFSGRALPSAFGPWSLSTDWDQLRAMAPGEPAGTTVAQSVMLDEAIRLTIQMRWHGPGDLALLDLNFHSEIRAEDEAARLTAVQALLGRTPQLEERAEAVRTGLLDE